MPANLTSDSPAAEQAGHRAQTHREKIAALEQMPATLPKHKGTEKIQADLRRDQGWRETAGAAEERSRRSRRNPIEGGAVRPSRRISRTKSMFTIADRSRSPFGRNVLWQICLCHRKRFSATLIVRNSG
jgi:hypothetical protein